MIKKLRFLIDKFFGRINFTISTKKQKYPLGTRLGHSIYIKNQGARTIRKGEFYWCPRRGDQTLYDLMRPHCKQRKKSC